MKTFVIILITMFFIPHLVFADSTNDLLVLNEKGTELIDSEKYSEAIKYFDKILEINQDDFRALSNKGNALLLMENPSEAIKYLEMAYQVNKTSSITLNSIGTAYLQLEQPSTAVNYFNKALSISPDSKSARENFVTALNELTYTSEHGMLEVILIDSQGYLVAYTRTEEISVLDHPLVRDMINNFIFNEEIKYNDELIMAKKYIYSLEITKDDAMGSFGLRIPNFLEVMFTLNHVWQQKVTSGDSLRLVYTFFSPIEE